MKICEIFSSIEGEGIRQGYLCTFIRTVGCNLRCSYCDSSYSFEVDDNTKDMTIEQIVTECIKLNNQRVTFTGGEPLLQKDALELIKLLIQQGFYVNIETNGAVDLTSFINYRNSTITSSENLIFTVDYKCPSSNMEHKMLNTNWSQLDFSKDVVKFVVGNTKDLDSMKNWVNEYPFTCNNIFVSPVFGKIDAKEIIEYLKVNNLQNIRMQLQIHKFIWPPEMRGV